MSNHQMQKNTVISSHTLEDIPKEESDIRIELEPVKKVPDETNWRTFIVGSASFYFFLHLSIISATFMNFYDYKLVKRMFKNFSNIGNGFDIFFLCAMILILTYCSVFARFPKKLKFAFGIILTICYWYFAFFLLRVCKKTKYRFTHYLLCIYATLFSSSFGLLVSSLTYKKKFRPDVGISISAVIMIIMLIVFVYVYEIFDPFKFELLAIVGLSTLYSHYLNYDIRYMIRKRAFYYDYSDWFIGGIHLQTDIFCRFWVDLFKPTPKIIDVEEIDLDERGKETDISYAIRNKTNDTAYTVHTQKGSHDFEVERVR